MVLHMFVGSCNVPTPYFGSANGDGVSVFRFDASTGTAVPVTSYNGIDNPTYLSTTPEGRRIFANSELFGKAQGHVTALEFDPETGAIIHLDMVASRGSITSHNSLSNDGRHLLVTNYALGSEGPDKSVAIFPITETEGIHPACSSAVHEGTGAHPERQERSHAHFIRQMPDGRLAVADLGIDKILLYHLSPNGALEWDCSFDMPDGMGPRHLAWTGDGRKMFVVGELDSTLASLSVSPGQPLELVDIVPAIDGEAAVGNHCSDIQISPDDRFLYVGNRGANVISVFAVETDGRLTAVQTISCGGETPRALALSPCGNWLLSANQDSDHIAVFSRNAQNGHLKPGPAQIELGTPMCIKFAEC
ncbi:lactonase family protein [Roseibium sp. HPY-6]|uniref:lactonase family protein n=1 Tax=Roseibium sp. HPY-6 TaxID=3229852 RepID=UPI00338D5834